MSSALIKTGEHRYVVSGGLETIRGPGRRTVRWLEVRRLRAGQDLSVLRAFAELETLELHHIDGVDLAPLADLSLKRLAIESGSCLDLDPITRLTMLETLVLFDLDRVHATSLTLPRTLQSLEIINDSPALTGEPVKHVIEAIDWSAVRELRALSTRVGGLYEMPPVDVDLGLLRALPRLEHLDMYSGLRHAGPGPSPIEPPFDGLSKRLRFVRLDAWNPPPLHDALQAYLGLDPNDPQSGPVVYQRCRVDARERPWTLKWADDGTWSVYGSLLREEHGEHDDTEHDAYHRANQRLRQTNPALLRRLRFDPESAGTGITAETRDDLETALRSLGITPQ
jgi:hypothetical protein